MKKYIQPSIKVAIIKAPTILAGSLTEGSNSIDKEKITTSDGIASKRGIFDYGTEE